jgi:predicted MPP superfamily phosphohydrolase
MISLILVLAVLVCWVGHACILTSILNNFYGRPWPKALLRLWRHFTALVLLAFPVLVWSGLEDDSLKVPESIRPNGPWGILVLVYAGVCLLFGGVLFPLITIARLLRPTPPSLISETQRSIDLWPELGEKLIGDHKSAPLTRLPWNGVFRVDFTEMTLALADLPGEWEGLTVLVLSDVHFHGTPSQVFFSRMLDEVLAGPQPDLVCLLGDIVDTKTHHEWIQPILGRLSAREAKLAILGNHDMRYQPEVVRSDLATAGYTVLGNSCRETTIRGVRCLVIGHEGPWFSPGPDLATAPAGVFRFCLSHTPDNFYWGIKQHVNLMLCGHVHGGGIRVPVIGPIFVPSVYGRRFDSGVFEKGGLTMVVGRGISGREPLRFRCDPQVIRLTLRKRSGS